IASRRQYDNPALEGIVESPVLRPDGSLPSSAGYDAETGLYLLPSVDVSVPANPTQEDARRARDTILEVVSDFPFAKQEHEDAWLAAVLTPLARAAMRGPAPLFLIDANVAGAGKTKLCDVASIINSGRTMARSAYVHDDSEMRKRVTTIAVAGDATILFDNIRGKLGCPSIDAALTATHWRDRKLATNETIDAALNTTFYATGNNIELVGDTVRRVLHVRLDSNLERPEERTGFKYPDLLGHVRAHRAELLSAALTILRA